MLLPVSALADTDFTRMPNTRSSLYSEADYNVTMPAKARHTSSIENSRLVLASRPHRRHTPIPAHSTHLAATNAPQRASPPSFPLTPPKPGLSPPSQRAHGHLCKLIMMGFSHVRRSLPDGGARGLACFPANMHHAPWPGRLNRAPIPLHAICALKSTHTSTMAMEAHDGLQPCAQIVTRRWRTRTGVFPS